MPPVSIGQNLQGPETDRKLTEMKCEMCAPRLSIGRKLHRPKKKSRTARNNNSCGL